ncbi:hypothetical protein E5676_scaffold29G001110 [Cucumis melo var. makuwa]|uniref:Uncharacterized protein n=1 Tax=Cucumis melo var. makuwa TaxID=1194695 RepID=A0A5D3BNP8_CUCMM|nr:hypothetical protein E5676_scaffold29G001110 [Cucumis melo var. makuwa]
MTTTLINSLPPEINHWIYVKTIHTIAFKRYSYAAVFTTLISPPPIIFNTVQPSKIMHNLKKKTEEDFTYTTFHVEKTLVNFKSIVPANLLCQNKGWSTVGKYFVRFEKWSHDTHATLKLIPSYGGWTTFRGIPLHMWNMQTFQQIGKWLIERNVQLHGTFKRQAAAIFDEYNPDSEQFFFDGADAISSDYLPSNFGSRKSITLEKTAALKSIISRIDRNATSAKEINEAAYNDNKLHAVDNKSRQGISSRISNDGLLDKGKKKVDIPLEFDTEIIKEKPKRKYKIKANQNKEDLNIQPIQIVTHELDAVKKGLTFMFDLEELPILDPNKSTEDHLSLDNAENGLKLSAVNEIHDATTSTNVLLNQMGTGLRSKGEGAPGTCIVK